MGERLPFIDTKGDALVAEELLLAPSNSIFRNAAMLRSSV